MNKKTIRDIDLSGKTVLVRVDYNVPIKDGKVGDPLRIKASFDTINFLLEQKCKIVLMSHLGRPDGKVDLKYSLEPVAKKAAQLLDHPIAFIDDCVGSRVEETAAALKPGQILLLENLRFHPAEEANDPSFAKQLASLGEVYVDDAFAAIHRAHASTVGVTKYLPAVSGLLVEREVNTITAALVSPKRPLVAVVGGAKVSDKIAVLSNLLGHVEVLIIGGAMANTFLAAEGYNIGKSRFEPDQIETAQRISREAADGGVDLVLPVDVVVTHKIDPTSSGRNAGLMEVEDNDIIVDIGTRTIERVGPPIHLAATVIWNGPLGITEIPAFANGSIQLAKSVMDSQATSIIGGGDTAGFIDDAGWHDKFDFISTGGGASLELMAGKPLPGVDALLDK